MKGKLVTMAVSFLLCVGMVGAGFASWVITNTAKVETEGTINVDTVVDKRLKMVVVEDQTNLNVFFGAPTSLTTTNQTPWLTNDSTQKQDLDATVTVKLDGQKLQTVAGNTGATINVKATFTIEANGETAYNNAIKYNLISAPTTLEETKTVSATSTSSDETVSFTFSFDWGTYFGESGNPYTYFNDSYATADDTKMAGGTDIVLPDDGENVVTGYEGVDAGDCAAFVLGMIEAIGEVTVKVTITATVAA